MKTKLFEILQVFILFIALVEVLNAQCPTDGLFITEFVYDVCDGNNEIGETVAASAEYFVLTNTSSIGISVDGAEFDDDGDLADDDGEILAYSPLINPGGCLIVSGVTQSVWESEYGPVSATGCTYNQTSSWDQLNNTGDNIGVTGACNNGSYDDLAADGEVMIWDGTSFVNGGVASIHSTCGPQTYVPGTAGTPVGCAVTSIIVSNMSDCITNSSVPHLDNNNSFTGDVTVTYNNRPTLGTMTLSTTTGTVTTAVINIGVNSHTFTGVALTATGGPISLAANFSADPFCTLLVDDAGTSPEPCMDTGCTITSVDMVNMSDCINGGDDSFMDNDYFTADMVICYVNPPSTGNLVLQGGVFTSVAVENLSSSTCHTFSDLNFPTNLAIHMEVYFEDHDSNCGRSMPYHFGSIQSCSYCLDFFDIPEDELAVVVVDRTCETDGSISAPSGNPCPEGSTLKYSIEIGPEWSTTIPIYDPLSPITVYSTCECNDSPVTGNIVSVTTSPMECPACIPPTLSSTSVSTCIGLSQGSIDLTATGGIGTYTYLWSNGAFTEDIAGLGAGTYSVTLTEVTNPNCTVLGSYTVGEYPSPSLTGDDVTVCEGEAIAFEVDEIGAGGNTYSWTTTAGNGFTSSLQDPIVTSSATSMDAGTYTVTFTDSNGCIATLDLVGTVNPVPTYTSIMLAESACGSDGVVLFAFTDVPDGNYNVSFSDANGMAISLSNIAVTGGGMAIGNLEAGDYSNFIIEGIPCISETDVQFSISATAAASISDDGPQCEGEELVITITSTGSTDHKFYLDADGDGLETSGETILQSGTSKTYSSTSLSNGDKICAVVDYDGDCFETVCTTVDVSAAPALTIDNPTLCYDGSTPYDLTSLEPSGMTGGTWTDGMLDAIASTVITPGDGHVYNYTFVDGNGCSVTAAVTLSVNSAPPATIEDITICEGVTVADIVLTSTNAENVNLSDFKLDFDQDAIAAGFVDQPTSTSLSNGTVAIPSPLATGSYGGEICLVYADGCQVTDPFTITVLALPTLSDAVVCLESSVVMTGSGNPHTTDPYVSSDLSVATITSAGVVTTLASGTSMITYTDENGCQAVAELTVNSLPVPSAGVIPERCLGSPDFVITGWPIPGAGETGTWSASSGVLSNINTTDGTATLNASTLTAGTYPVTYSFVDGGGCEGDNIVMVIVYASPTLSAEPSICVGETVSVVGSGVAAGSDAYTSSDTGVATVTSVGSVTGVAAGTATITYTDENGCTTEGAVTVFDLPSIEDAVVCEGATVAMMGSGTAHATDPYAIADISIATVSPSGVVTGVAEGTTTITYTDENGCTVDGAVTVFDSPSIGDALVCEGAMVTLMGSGVAHATDPYTIADVSIATVSHSGIVTGVAAGTTTITYTNANGCTADGSVTVFDSPSIEDALVCEGATVTMIGSGTANVIDPYVITDASIATVSSSGVVTGVSAGMTTITYSDENGCQSTATVTVVTMHGGATVQDVVTCGSDLVFPLVLDDPSGIITQFLVDFDSTANAAGLQDVSTMTSVTGAQFSSAGILPVGTYNGVITLAASSGCNTEHAFSITIRGTGCSGSVFPWNGSN